MSKMIQIRNVPDQVHRTLKARAALAGKSLSDYLLAEIAQVASRPTLEEMLQRLDALPRVDLPISSAELIRQERDSR
jgi:plasmid stability protein